MLLTKCSVLCLFTVACWTLCAANNGLDKNEKDLLDPVLVSSDGNIPSAKRIIRQHGVIRTRDKDGRYVYRKMGASVEPTPGPRVVRAYPERRGYKINKPKPTRKGYVYTTPKPTRPPPIGIESTEENDSQFVTPDPPPASVSPEKGFLPNKPSDDDGWDIRDSIPGTPGVDYKVYGSIPETNFTCEGKTPGFYADPEAGCQVFHRCSDDPWYSGQYRVNMDSFLCPNGSLFNQQIYTCDWWGNVDCSGSERFYELNEQIGQLEETSLGTIQYVQFSGARVPPPPGKKRKAPEIIPKSKRGPLPDEYRSTHEDEEKGSRKVSKGSDNKQAAAVGFEAVDDNLEDNFKPYTADEEDEEGSSQTIKEVRAKPPTTTRKPAAKRSGQTTRKPKAHRTTTESSRTRAVAYKEDNIIPAAQEANPFVVNNDRDGPVTENPYDLIPPTAEFDEGNDPAINDAVAADPANDNVPPADPINDEIAPSPNDEVPEIPPSEPAINAEGADPNPEEDDLNYVPPTSAVTTVRTTSRSTTTQAPKNVSSAAGGYPGSKGKGGYSGGGSKGGYSGGGSKGGYSGGGYSGGGKGGYSQGYNNNNRNSGGYSTTGGRGGYAGGGGYKTSATNRYAPPARGYSYPKPNKANPQNSVSEGRETRVNSEDEFLTPPNREPLENDNDAERNFLPPDAKAELNSYVPPQQNNKPGQDYLPPKNDYLPPKNDYGPPKNDYGPPKNDYGPPKNDYGPPKSDYGPPSNNAYLPPSQNAYLPPKNNAYLPPSYGPPTNPDKTYLPPKDNYGPPPSQNTYLPPKDDYGPPRAPETTYLPPKDNYGPPPAPDSTYLPPKDDYGPPRAPDSTYLPPKDDYGPPRAPDSTYLPPKHDYGPPPTPENTYLPPKNDYGLPSTTENAYLPPKDGYGTPTSTENAYLPPKDGYGPPTKPENTYLPPKDNYGPPPTENTYLPPKDNYGPPPTENTYLPPKDNYGPPVNNNYLPPTPHPNPENTYSETPDSYYRKPSTGYGAPVTEPTIAYGIPQTTVTEPSQEYGHGITAPTEFYGLPSVQPSGNYGPPVTEPSSNYGFPVSEPSNQYLPQKDNDNRFNPQPTSAPYVDYLTIPLKEYGIPPQNNFNGPNDESGAAQQQNNEYIPPPSTDFTTPRNEYLPPQDNKEYLPPQNKEYLPPQNKEYLPPPKEYGTPHNNGYLPPPGEYGTPQNKVYEYGTPQNKGYLPPPNEYGTPHNNYLPSKVELYFPPKQDYGTPTNDFLPSENEYRFPRNYAPQMRYQELPQFAALQQDFREYIPPQRDPPPSQQPSQFLTEASTYRSTPYRYHSVSPPKIEFFTAPLVSYSHVVNPLNRSTNDNYFKKKK